MKVEQLKSLPDIGQVLRYHGDTGPVGQNIAAHSWGVAALLLQCNPRCSINLMAAAVFHDAAEKVIGDVSYMAKKRWPKLKEALDEAEAEVEEEQGLMPKLTEDEHRWLKWADSMECALWCLYMWEDYGFRKYRGMFINAFEAADGCPKPNGFSNRAQVLMHEVRGPYNDMTIGEAA